MLNKFFKSVLSLVAIAMIMVSCSSDNVKESDFNNQNKEVLGIGGKIKVSAKLHRGDRWSNKRNVPPCTMSFGICQVSIQIEIDFPIPPKGYETIELELLKDDVLRIAFDDGVKIPGDKIFFSKEENYFAFPSDVTKHFKLTKMEIVPDDYIVQLDDPKYPYGFVDVKVVTK